jgi:DNA-binding winged helix-turn-helix (wHTH) protein/tetratricopeptide (TPR) repeat protein
LNRTHHPSSASPGFEDQGSGSGREQPTLFFAGFRLEADGSLFRGEVLLHLPPRELAALKLLLANAGQIVPPLQLKQALWGDVHVTADSVPRCLSSLRARLQPDNCIQTVYKRGYRLFAEVRPFLASSAQALPRLAIPPFTADVGVPEHLGTAIAEETIARLSNAQRPLASILARDSVFTLATRGLTAQQIGASLNADLVLAGTLRSFNFHLRLRMEMIRVADGVQIWVEDLLVERAGIAGLESDLASRLDFRLKTRRLDSWPGTGHGHRQPVHPAEGRTDGSSSMESMDWTGGTPAPSTSWGTESLSISAVAEPVFESASNSPRREAYEVYLRGHHEWQTLERHRMQDGLQHLTRAAELDPSLIAAKVDLIHLCVIQALCGYMPSAAAAGLVHRTAESIPDFPSQAEAALPAVAWVNLHFDRNLPAAQWAIELSTHLPHDPWITRVRVMVALSRHRFAEAIALLRAAIQLDPFSPWLHSRLAWALHLDGQARESVVQTEQAIHHFPSHMADGLYGSMILAFNGHAERAVELAHDLVQRHPYFDLATAAQAYTLACAGRTAEARAILERLSWLGRERFVIKSFTPAAYIALGDLDAALSELRAANDDRCPWFFQMLADPRLRPLHGHPEFEELRAILPRMEAAAHTESDG